jgi:hypothetical protein
LGSANFLDATDFLDDVVCLDAAEPDRVFRADGWVLDGAGFLSGGLL